MIQKDMKKVREWLKDILIVEYKKEKKSKLKLEDIMRMFKECSREYWRERK